MHIMSYKKVVNVSALVVLVGGVIVSIFSFVQAFGDLQEGMVYDGTVTAKAENTILLLTPAAETIPFRIISGTDFMNGLRIEDISTGECLRIKTGGAGAESVARSVEKISCGVGYGYR